MHITSPCLLTETEVSKQLRSSVATLRRWRTEGRGPKFVKLGTQLGSRGGLVRYTDQSVQDWLARQATGGEQATEEMEQLDGIVRRYLTYPEIANEYGGSVGFWKKRVFYKKIAYYKYGSTVRIARADIEKFLDSCRVPSQEEDDAIKNDPSGSDS